MAPSAFDDFENTNLAAEPAHADMLQSLLTRMHTEVERWITPVNPSAKADIN